MDAERPVKLKPLKWEKKSVSSGIFKYQAQTVFGTMCIGSFGKSQFFWITNLQAWQADKRNRQSYDCESFEDGMRQAEARYLERLKPFLDG